MHKAKVKQERFRLMISFGAIGNGHLSEVFLALQQVTAAHFDESHVAVLNTVLQALRCTSAEDAGTPHLP